MVSSSHLKYIASRRQFLAWSLLGLGGTAAIALAVTEQQRRWARPKIPTWSEEASTERESFQPMSILREFDYGKVFQENGRTVREFRVVANSSAIQLNAAVSFVSWGLNGRIPGPTLRATAGDRLRIVFQNDDGHSHSLHFHGLHPAEMDGVEPIRHGKTTVYEFDAEPYGVHPYHCHVAPVTRHVGKGLYGLLIIDPPQGRSPADEMVLVMGGYDLDDDGQNELYAFNGIPNYYRDHPIAIYQHQLVRLYLLNMIEQDPAVTFHIHANLFQVYPTGRTLKPTMETDVITMGTAERHILEFSYSYPGMYMFHPHQDAIAEHGAMGMFHVLEA
jgi:FtsP/CotA-like multicopper oxidase with cupredoxin domain